MTAVSPLSIIRLAEILISLRSFSSIILTFPRFPETYCETAAGVTPSFSAVSFWFNLYSLIILVAISRRITGSPFHIMNSQGVAFIVLHLS